jgi:hypothetical protein
MIRERPRRPPDTSRARTNRSTTRRCRSPQPPSRALHAFASGPASSRPRRRPCNAREGDRPDLPRRRTTVLPWNARGVRPQCDRARAVHGHDTVHRAREPSEPALLLPRESERQQRPGRHLLASAKSPTGRQPAAFASWSAEAEAEASGRLDRSDVAAGGSWKGQRAASNRHAWFSSTAVAAIGVDVGRRLVHGRLPVVSFRTFARVLVRADSVVHPAAAGPKHCDRRPTAGQARVAQSPSRGSSRPSLTSHVRGRKRVFRAQADQCFAPQEEQTSSDGRHDRFVGQRAANGRLLAVPRPQRGQRARRPSQVLLSRSGRRLVVKM